MDGPEWGLTADYPTLATNRGDRENMNVIIGMD